MTESQVLHLSFYSEHLQQDKKYCIYLPPSYNYIPECRYSTIYLLPGLMDYERTWCDRGRVHDHMDNLIYSRKIHEMIIVMPDKDQAALEPQMTEAFEGYLMKDVLNHVDREFRTIAHRNHRGVEGLSLGASWTLRLAIGHPELYSSIGCLSGGYGEETYRTILTKKDYLHSLGMRFRIGVGTAEPEFIEDSRKFAEFLKGLGFYCEFALDDGPHDWPLWTYQISNSLQFHDYTFNPKR